LYWRSQINLGDHKPRQVLTGIALVIVLAAFIYVVVGVIRVWDSMSTEALSVPAPELYRPGHG